MNTLQEFHEYGDYLNGRLKLRFSPIAFKMLWEGDEIPEGTTRPVEDGGKRFAMCQAFGYVRRNRKGLTMLEEDQWCVWPLACLKLRELDNEDCETMGDKLFIRDREKSMDFFKNRYPWLETNGRKPIGFSAMPLESCTFVPDVVITYCRNSQLTAMLRAMKYETGEVPSHCLDDIVSCAYSTVPVLNGKTCTVTLPDPGEYERALADEDEIIFSVRGDAMETLIRGLKGMDRITFNYPDLNLDMNLEFPRARFYDDLFRKWGLKTGEVWKQGKLTK